MRDIHRYSDVLTGKNSPSNLAPYEVAMQRAALSGMWLAANDRMEELKEYIYRLSWMYKKDPAQVEKDMYASGERQLEATLGRPKVQVPR